jgi:uncharacterized protein
MKKTLISFLLVCLSLLTMQLKGQDSIYLSSDKYISDGIELHDKGEYDKAIACYKKVSLCDPSYEKTCYEMALSYYYLDKYDEAKAKCEEAIALGYDHAVVYNLLGSILDDQGNQKEAIDVLSGALKKWPYNQSLIYNLAVCQISSDQPLKAEELLLKSIRINPYHTRSHLALAKANYMMGRTAQSCLAYSMVMVLNPSVNNIASFEEMISQKTKLRTEEYNYPYPKDVNPEKWERLKDLLQSEIVFNKDFDYNFNYNYMVARQSFMLMKNLTYDPADTSLYNRLYARMFVDIYQKMGFDTYANYILQNTKDEDVAKWSKKYPEKIKSFISWGQDFLNQGRMYAFSYKDEKDGKRMYHYDENGNLASIGETSGKDGDIKNGTFLIIGDEGDLREKGVYVNNLAEGEWLVYFPDGTIENKLNFKHDQQDGKNQIFYPNGALKSLYYCKDGKKDGAYERYTHSGFDYFKEMYTDDKANGPGFYNNYSEGFKRTYTYLNDSIEGETTETWMNGNPKEKCSYHLGMVTGPYASWYSNSSKESERNYRNDTLTGKYYSYYSNNQKSAEYEYDANGELVGKVIYYDRAGNITAREGEYSDGKLKGTRTEYYTDGKVKRELTYQDGQIKAVVCFDGKGNQLYKAENADSSIYIKSFYSDGIISSEGRLTSDKRQGTWKFYNPLGNITDELNYSSGKQEGLQRSFYQNGQVEKESTCSGDYTLGEYKEYYINGHMKIHGNYDSTGIAGKWIYYHENDSISNIIFYKKGKVAGRSMEFYPNGKLKAVDICNSDGLYTGRIEYKADGTLVSDLRYEYGSHTFTINYPNGKLKEKRCISDNVLNGVQEEYYPNGKMLSSVEYSHGILIGSAKKWDYDGNLTYEMPYVLGSAEGEGKWYEDNKLDFVCLYEQDKRQGKSTGYYPNGQKEREFTYEEGTRTGNSDYFSPEGTLMYRIRFENNTIKAYSYLGKDGNMVPEIAITDTTTRIRTYYPNGNVSAAFSICKGLYQGKLTTYYSAGTKLREASFNLDQAEGVEKYYYPNNKLRELITYSCDNRNGLYEKYYENGKKQKSGKYNVDNPDGEWTVYNPDGSIKEMITYSNGVIYDIK